LRSSTVEVNELAERIDREVGHRHSEFSNWTVIRKDGKVLGFDHQDMKIRLNSDKYDSVTVQANSVTPGSDLVRTVTVPFDPRE